MRVDADAAVQGVADDVLLQAEGQIQQVIARQEADARLFGRGGHLADGELLQDLDVGRTELPRGVAFDLKTLEADRAGKESHDWIVLEGKERIMAFSPMRRGLGRGEFANYAY